MLKQEKKGILLWIDGKCIIPWAGFHPGGSQELGLKYSDFSLTRLNNRIRGKISIRPAPVPGYDSEYTLPYFPSNHIFLVSG